MSAMLNHKSACMIPDLHDQRDLLGRKAYCSEPCDNAPPLLRLAEEQADLTLFD